MTPGVVYTDSHPQWDAWIGLGLPIGLTTDTNHLGVSVRTGTRF